MSAVIPAFNEEKTIASVITALLKAPSVGEIIVVSDGSTDNTATVASLTGVKVIRLPKNIGKGGAMMEGVTCAKNDIILFVDADLLGLTPGHAETLTGPVMEGRADMTIGIFEKGRPVTDLAQFFAPFLSGQRAVRKELMAKITNLESARFGAELVMTRFVTENNLRTEEIYLSELSQVIKEEKLGLVKGFSARMRMYWEIAKCVSGTGNQ